MPTGSGEGPCDCEACIGGVPKQSVATVTGFTNVQCNQCPGYDGAYVATAGPNMPCHHFFTMGGGCGGMGGQVQFGPGRIFLILDMLFGPGQTGTVSYELVDSDPDCLAGGTLTLISSTIGQWCIPPSTATVVAVAPAISSLREWECILKRCPCQPVPVPSSREKHCCFPNPKAPPSHDCPCGCEPAQVLQISDDCVCMPSACVRCLAGCSCQPPKCCAPPQQECSCGGSCGCGGDSGGCGGSCGCGSGNGGGRGEHIWAGPSGGGSCGCDGGGTSCQGCEASGCG